MREQRVSARYKNGVFSVACGNKVYTGREAVVIAAKSNNIDYDSDAAYDFVRMNAPTLSRWVNKLKVFMF